MIGTIELTKDENINAKIKEEHCRLQTLSTKMLNSLNERFKLNDSNLRFISEKDNVLEKTGHLYIWPMTLYSIDVVGKYPVIMSYEEKISYIKDALDYVNHVLLLEEEKISFSELNILIHPSISFNGYVKGLVQFSLDFSLARIKKILENK